MSGFHPLFGQRSSSTATLPKWGHLVEVLRESSGACLCLTLLLLVQRAVVPRAAAVAEQSSLIFPSGVAGAWDEGGISNPIVRCYQGDDEQRWYMWYTGRGPTATPVDAVFPAAGKIGACLLSLHGSLVCAAAGRTAAQHAFCVLVGGPVDWMRKVFTCKRWRL